MSEKIEIIPEILIHAKRPGERHWSVYEDPEDLELQYKLREAELAAYRILRPFFDEIIAIRNKIQEKP